MKKLFVLSFVICAISLTGCDQGKQQEVESKENLEPTPEQKEDSKSEKQTRLLFPNIFTPIVEILMK